MKNQLWKQLTCVDVEVKGNRQQVAPHSTQGDRNNRTTFDDMKKVVNLHMVDLSKFKYYSSIVLFTWFNLNILITNVTFPVPFFQRNQNMFYVSGNQQVPRWEHFKTE